MKILEIGGATLNRTFHGRPPKKVEKKKSVSQPDEPIAFAQLMVRDGSDALEDELQKSLMAAVSGKMVKNYRIFKKI